MPASTVSVTRVDSGFAERVNTLVDGEYCSRIAAKEPGLWGPSATSEASIRLGWTHAPSDMADVVTEVSALRSQLAEQGVTRVVLCGMGGSSLAPEVMARADGVELDILDSTHPDHVRSLVERDLADTVVVVSSKSGTTVETATAKASFEEAFRGQGIEPRERIVIVTDPGSPLHTDSEDVGYRVFLSDPHVGGRFSALTAFGLVPATLAGVDTAHVLQQAQSMHEQMARDSADNPAISLAAALADPEQGIMCLVDSDNLPGFGDWVEQLVAESTGKDGKGVLPVVTSRLGPDAELDDVVAVTHTANGDVSVQTSLGAGFVLWEWATALVGVLIAVNPFDQPDVESAKIAARALLDELPTRPEPVQADGVDIWLPSASAGPLSLDEAVSQVLQQVSPSGYLALQLYVNRLTTVEDDIRSDLATRVGRPVTVGYGPRFLHSTGQLHKGGPDDGIFVQIEWQAEQDVAIPGYPFSYQQLIDAQAWGDRSVLLERGRPVLTLRVSNDAGFARALTALRG